MFSKKNLVKFIRPSPNIAFNCRNCKGIKYLKKLRVGLSHLREHKFKHSFQNTLNTFCSCGLDVETNMHFFLYCPLFSTQRCTLLSTVNDIDSSLTNTDDTALIDILLLGKASLDITANTLILAIDEQIWSKFVLVFYNFHLNVYLFNFFQYPNVLFETLHSYFT